MHSPNEEGNESFLRCVYVSCSLHSFMCVDLFKYDTVSSFEYHYKQMPEESEKSRRYSTPR